MRRILLALLLLTAWLPGAVALAHEGGAHAKGTVHQVSAGEIMLQTTDGKMVTLPIGKQAQVLRGARAIAVTDIKPGERAVVHAMTRDGKLEATEIRVAEPPR